MMIGPDQRFLWCATANARRKVFARLGGSGASFGGEPLYKMAAPPVGKQAAPGNNPALGLLPRALRCLAAI